MKIDSACRFCRSNNLLQGEVIAENQGGYLIRASQAEQNYLVIPHVHAEHIDEMPDGWWASLTDLAGKIGNLADFNVSLNIGPAAGQTMKHLHFWVIPREEGQPASGKGLARLIYELNVE